MGPAGAGSRVCAAGWGQVPRAWAVLWEPRHRGLSWRPVGLGGRAEVPPSGRDTKVTDKDCRLARAMDRLTTSRLQVPAHPPRCADQPHASLGLGQECPGPQWTDLSCEAGGRRCPGGAQTGWRGHVWAQALVGQRPSSHYRAPGLGSLSPDRGHRGRWGPAPRQPGGHPRGLDPGSQGGNPAPAVPPSVLGVGLRLAGWDLKERAAQGPRHPWSCPDGVLRGIKQP